MACGIFSKDRKKVTLNMDTVQYLPEEIKDKVNMSALANQSAMGANAASQDPNDHTLKLKDTASDFAKMTPDERKFFTEYDK